MSLNRSTSFSINLRSNNQDIEINLQDKKNPMSMSVKNLRALSRPSIKVVKQSNIVLDNKLIPALNQKKDANVGLQNHLNGAHIQQNIIHGIHPHLEAGLQEPVKKILEAQRSMITDPLKADSKKLIEGLKANGIVNDDGKIDFLKWSYQGYDIAKLAKQACIKGTVFLKEDGTFDFSIKGQCGDAACKIMEAWKNTLKTICDANNLTSSGFYKNITPSIYGKPSNSDLKALKNGGQIRYQKSENDVLKLILDPGYDGANDNLTLSAYAEKDLNDPIMTQELPLETVFEGGEYEGAKALTKEGKALLSDWRARKLFEQSKIVRGNGRDNMDDIKRIQAQNTLWDAVDSYLKLTGDKREAVFQSGGALINDNLREINNNIIPENENLKHQNKPNKIKQPELSVVRQENLNIEVHKVQKKFSGELKVVNEPVIQNEILNDLKQKTQFKIENINDIILHARPKRFDNKNLLTDANIQGFTISTINKKKENPFKINSQNLDIISQPKPKYGFTIEKQGLEIPRQEKEKNVFETKINDFSIEGQKRPENTVNFVNEISINPDKKTLQAKQATQEKILELEKNQQQLQEINKILKKSNENLQQKLEENLHQIHLKDQMIRVLNNKNDEQIKIKNELTLAFNALKANFDKLQKENNQIIQSLQNENQVKEKLIQEKKQELEQQNLKYQNNLDQKEDAYNKTLKDITERFEENKLQLNKTNDLLMEVNRALTESKEKLRESKEKLIQTNNQSNATQRTLQETQEELKRAKDRITMLTSNLQNLQLNIQEGDIKASQQEETIQNLNRQIDELKKQLSINAKTKEEAEVKHKKIVEEFSNTIKDLEGKLMSAANDKKELQNQLEVASKQLKEAKQLENAQNEKINNIKIAADEKIREEMLKFQQLIKDLKEGSNLDAKTKKSLVNRIDWLKQQLNIRIDQIVQDKREIQELKEKYVSIEKGMRDIRTQNADKLLNKKINELQAEIMNFQVKNEELKGRYQDKQKQVEDLQKQLNHLRLANEKAEELTNELDMAKIKIQRLEKQMIDVNELQEKIETLKNQLEMREKYINNHEDDRNMYQNEINELGKEIDSLTNKNMILAGTMEEARQLAPTIKAIMDHLEEKINKLKDDKKTLEDMYDDDPEQGMNKEEWEFFIKTKINDLTKQEDNMGTLFLKINDLYERMEALFDIQIMNDIRGNI